MKVVAGKAASDPLLSFKIGRMNGREARESGLWHALRTKAAVTGIALRRPELVTTWSPPMRKSRC